MTTPPLDLKCTATARAWVADLGTPLPSSWDEPLPSDYRTVGLVGYGDEDVLRLIEPPPEPALHVGAEPERPWVTPQPDRADIVLHEAHLMPGHGRYVLVLDALDGSVRLAVPHVEHHGYRRPENGWRRRVFRLREECPDHSLIVMRVRIGSDDDGMSYRQFVDPATVGAAP